MLEYTSQTMIYESPKDMRERSKKMKEIIGKYK